MFSSCVLNKLSIDRSYSMIITGVLPVFGLRSEGCDGLHSAEPSRQVERERKRLIIPVKVLGMRSENVGMGEQESLNRLCPALFHARNDDVRKARQSATGICFQILLRLTQLLILLNIQNSLR